MTKTTITTRIEAAITDQGSDPSKLAQLAVDAILAHLPAEQTEIEQAYGLLWRTLGTDQKVHEARKLLLGNISKDGQRRGIAFANKKYGPVTDNEALAKLP